MLEIRGFLQLIIFLCLASSCLDSRFNSGAKQEMKKAPGNYPIEITESSAIESHEKIKNRCHGGDGPKGAKSAFIGSENQSIQNLDHWTNDNGFLLERAFVKSNETEYFVTIEQSGCAHYGHTIKISLAENFNYNLGQKELYQSLVNILESLPLSKDGRKITQVILDPLEKKVELGTLKNYCEKMDKKFLCSIYEDPENVELHIRNRTIRLNYWYVL